MELNRQLFDGMAEGADQHTVRGLRYQLPLRSCDKILARYRKNASTFADLGCGTGLLGEYCLGRSMAF